MFYHYQRLQKEKITSENKMYKKRYYSTSTTENNHERDEIDTRPTMKQNLERLLKLRPYPILDTDPTLNDSPYSTSNTF